MAPPPAEAAPFVVKGCRRNGTITYLCPDAAWALRKLGDFERMGYTDIFAMGPNGRRVSEADLTALSEPGKVPQDAEL